MKLLARSTRSHVILAIIALLVAIPIYYIAIQRIVKEDVDEGLMAQKHDLLLHLQKDSSLASSFVRDFVELIPGGSNKAGAGDTLYTKVIYDSLSRENIPYRILETYISLNGKHGIARFQRSLIDGEDLIESIIIVGIIMLLVIITGMIVTSRIESKRLWSPFYKSLDQFRSFEIEKKQSLSLPETTIDEFNDLYQSIHSLTGRSRNAFESQKAFTENASHEMQTPLAILQGKLDLLMQTEPLTPEQAALISDLADASQRMNHLNKNLLLLTRIENQQFHEKQPVFINDVVSRMLDIYREQADIQVISIETKMTDDIRLEANSALTDILISNLISNAIRHNHVNGMVGISQKGNILLIKNTGHPSPLDSTTMYGRFKKDSTDKDSLGLGLAISHKICELSGYLLHYDFVDGLHVFRIQFRNNLSP